MSQSVPPPGNPFAGGPVPGNPGNPFAPAPPVRDTVGLGLGAAAATAVAAAGIYGGIAGAVESEIGFGAIAVGFVIGLVAGKVGGRNPILAVVSAVFALAAVYLGQIFGIAIIVADELSLSTTDVLFDNFSLLTEAWNQSKDAMTFLFFALAAFSAFSGAKKSAS